MDLPYPYPTEEELRYRLTELMGKTSRHLFCAICGKPSIIAAIVTADNGQPIAFFQCTEHHCMSTSDAIEFTISR